MIPQKLSICLQKEIKITEKQKRNVRHFLILLFLCISIPFLFYGSYLELYMASPRPYGFGINIVANDASTPMVYWIVGTGFFIASIASFMFEKD